MSAISGFINQIRTAVYGEQVRGAIVSALEQCYSDVTNPSLQTAAFEEALNTAYAGGILDIQTVTRIADMTNEKIIYRYNGTEAGKNKGLYFYSAITSAWVLIGSEIQEVNNVNQMTDQKAIYRYTGTAAGMVTNALYCYNGTAWTPIGSGLLDASLVANMVNQGALYRYTGTESGMVKNGLYYWNGTAWVLATGANYEIPAAFKALYDVLIHLGGLFDTTDGMDLLNTFAESIGEGYYIRRELNTLIISESAPLTASVSGAQLTLS